MCYPVVSLNLNNQAYRIRFVETELPPERRTSIFEFGYNPDVKNIGIMRLNQSGEQVLYTSTNPGTSYIETISNKNLNYPFYLSVWCKKDANKLCNCFISSFDSCSKDSNSNAYKIKTEYRKNVDSEQELTITEIGKVLEKEYSELCSNKYEESAQLASNIFKIADCIITPSAKNNDEVNLTFNKRFADESLVLDRIYFCNPFPNGCCSLVFRVVKIGLVVTNRVVWYNWHVKDNILLNTDSNQEIEYIDNRDSLIYPNIIKPINDWHIGWYDNNKVRFKIKIEKE